MLFIENAYSVLGLEPEAPEKDILKRSREIENLLKIDEVPEYDVDFPFSKASRTEAKVKDAAERLVMPNKKIAETFFWIIPKGNTSEKAIELFRGGKQREAIEMLQDKIAKLPNDFVAWHNKAVLESLAFAGKPRNRSYLVASLKSWKTILDSGRQWSDFKKVYCLNNPNISEAQLNTFRDNTEKILSEFYEDVSKAEGNFKIYSTFSGYFSAHSDSFDREILDPLLNELNTITKKAGNYKVTYDSKSYADYTDKWVSEDSKDNIRKILKKADGITDKIEAMGHRTWNSSKVRVVRDNNATALRSLAMRIVAENTNLVDHAEDKDLVDDILEVAYNISSEGSLVERQLSDDVDEARNLNVQLTHARNRKAIQSLLQDIATKIRYRDFRGAIRLIDRCLDYDLGQEDSVQLLNLRQNLAEKVYGHRHESDGMTWVAKLALASIGVIGALVAIFAIASLVNEANKGRLDEALDETLTSCLDNGITSPECKSSQSKNGVTCSSRAADIVCEKQGKYIQRNKDNR